ncbi:MAG: hypothetical protein ACFB21_15085 [Opitutales bacterium]
MKISRPFSFVAASGFALATLAAEPAPPIALEFLWYRYADPGGEAHPDAPWNPLTNSREGYETDRGEVGGESAVISPDGRLVVTTSRANARQKAFDDPPRYTMDLHGRTSHVRLFTIDGELLWDRARSRGPDNVNNETGNPPGDGIPDDVPPGDDPGVFEDELEHGEFTVHESNAGRYVVAAGEDDKIEVWEIMDAEGNVLEAPTLVRTLFIPGGRVAAFDSLGFSSSGELLTGGTEWFGHVEFWRATGHPDTWEHVGHLSHGGGNIGKAVNEFDFSPDDRFLLTAGTDQWGRFFELDIQRNGEGDIVSVSAVGGGPLAEMPQPERSAKAARIEPVTGRHAVIASKDQRMFVFHTDDLRQGINTPMITLHNGFYYGVDRMTGTEIEPGGYSTSGRFLIQGGGPEERFEKHPNSADYESSFFRIFDTTELQRGAPEPDPVWVQPAFHTEFFHFHTDDSLLATSHDDGTARLWKTNISGTYTIAAEAFNERTETHNRWTLSGPAGGSDFGVSHMEPLPWKIDNGFNNNPADIEQDAVWVGLRGSRFLAIDELDGVHALTLNETWGLAGYTDLMVHFAAAAADDGSFESGDFLRLLADTTGDGNFETTIAEFLANGNGRLQREGSDETLDFIFQDFRLPLAPFLNSSEQIRFRIEANNDKNAEEMAFDTLRVTGRPLVTASLRMPQHDAPPMVSFQAYPQFHYDILASASPDDLAAVDTLVPGLAGPVDWTDEDWSGSLRFYGVRAYENLR